MTIKGSIKKMMLQSGYHVQRIDPNRLGRDPFQDMHRLANAATGAILFDIGANIGQTSLSFQSYFDSPEIHVFEPSSSTFAQLKGKLEGIPNVHLNDLALGAQSGRKDFFNNSQSTLSSFLPPGKDYCWGGEVTGQSTVQLESLDGYCESRGIHHIDVLKCDTQGYDCEVFKGGTQMLQQHKVHLIYVELNFGDLYAGMPQFEDVTLLLKSFGFVPVSFYNQTLRNSVLGWMDGLFIDPLWSK